MADNQIPPKRVVFLFWQGYLSNSQTDFLYEILLFGKDVKMFVDTYLQ